MHPSAFRAALLSAALPTVTALGAFTPLRSLDAQQVRVFSGAPREIEIVRGTVMLNRPMLGVTVGEDSQRGDTLGLRIEDVRENAPAARAGLKAGDRLQAINGVSLRADRNDAGHDDYDGMLTRRLQRELAKVEPGDTVRLQVLSDGRSRELRVATISPNDLYQPERAVLRRSIAGGDRLVLGVTTSPSGSARDTLGVFVSAVTDEGPAAKAGLVEGDRIAAINGVSLRVAREDAGDAQVAMAKANRLRAELEKLEAGQSVELTVVSAGRSRSVRVTPVKASELPGAAGGSFIWSTSPEALRESMLRMREFAPPPPVPPSAPVPPVAPTAPRVRTILRDVRTL
ncbi:MAG TPA: PDZ domain-containing protein [Gemmatimonadaceae bacterium]|nr:PDZ domain-containing protein [Gemmatimonadaceae bacterium]